MTVPRCAESAAFVEARQLDARRSQETAGRRRQLRCSACSRQSLSLAAPTTSNPSQAGVALSSDGQPVVRFHPCEGGGVTGLWLFDYTSVTPENPDPTPTNEVWLIEADDPVDVDSFVLGEVPDGFSETLSLQAPLAENREYHVSIAGGEGDRAGSYADFVLEDLVSGDVLVNGTETIPEDEFAQWGASQCAKDPLAEIVRWWFFMGAGFLTVVVALTWLLVRS